MAGWLQAEEVCKIEGICCSIFNVSPDVCVYLSMLEVSTGACMKHVSVFLPVHGGVCIAATTSVSTPWTKNEQFVSPHHFTNEISAARRWINIIRKARVGH